MKKEEGFHVICGLSPKNGFRGYISGMEEIAGDITKSEGRLDLSGLNSLLVADFDYFIKHHGEILEMVKGQIERRDSEEHKKWIVAEMCRKENENQRKK